MNQTISYALDFVDTAMKSKWPMMTAYQAAFEERKMGCRTQYQGKQDVALTQATIPDALTLAMPEGGIQAGTSTSPQVGVKKTVPYHYQTMFSDEEDSDNNEDVDVEQNPIDLEWAFYKRCGWKMYGSKTATCLDWW